jgi:hypothetical protein
MTLQRTSVGPGPEERKLRNRLIFRLTGRWPKVVVAERLLRLELDRAELLRVVERLFHA